ncbi:hypothetical protein [Paenibacillus taiwanensis]|uniref:hypothetical protein n=1 Tax=Paenibacillus taiwanensis TaxID=401638 RepID=UPI000491D144|nr:hypothetical protein [Paenibacillus taiwanensis]
MEQRNQQYVMELVLFELKEGTDKLRFCEAATALSEVLETRVAGFKGRTLLHTSDEIQWTDIIYWTDMDKALAAMGQLKSEPAFHHFVSMIDGLEIIQRHLIPTNLSM